jgi:SAM-dependent methyltransferase
MTTSQTSREWQAAEYHRLSAPQVRWGQRVLDELDLRGDEFVLDAGCGTGRLTRTLLENLPNGRVVGLDLSRNMVMHAQETLHPEFRDRIWFVAADLVVLPFVDAFDGIFSTASFHWVLDHQLLFSNLFAALKPGGWLHAQCGGGPNLARLRERVRLLSRSPRFEQWLGGFEEPWFFSDDIGAAARLRAAGFENIKTSLEESPVYVSSAPEFDQYLRTFILHCHLESLPSDALRDRYVQQLTDDAAYDNPPWTLDYWRLNLRASKPR